MKLRHRKGYYPGCYRDVDSKSWGCESTLKEALDAWWNSVRVYHNGKTYVCYKNAYTCDEPYELDGLPKSWLKKQINLADEWDDDGDGYPIIRATFVEEMK